MNEFNIQHQKIQPYLYLLSSSNVAFQKTVSKNWSLFKKKNLNFKDRYSYHSNASVG